MSLRAVKISVFGLALLAALLAVLLYEGFLRFNYPGLDEFPVHGVDVSHHQGTIDWGALQGPRVTFAYIKATEGETFKDPAFLTNWNRAAAAGVVPGAYHFFSLCKPAADQARNLVGSLSAVTGVGLPPAVDLEFGGNCSQRPTRRRFAGELTDFLEIVEARLGCRPILYATEEFYDAYLTGRFDTESFWMRNIFRRPLRKTDWLFWQFANRGRMPGVQTFIDLNVFAGDHRQLHGMTCQFSGRRP